MANGNRQPCCCIDLLRAQKEQGFSDELACYMSGSLLQAGSETTSAILIGFAQAMVVFPEVAKRAQADLDRVCGDRLPDLNDVPDLTYIRGCMKESLRWMPAAVLGVPHAVTQDDSYLGYHIPKGATVIFNVWYVCVYTSWIPGVVVSNRRSLGPSTTIPRDTLTRDDTILRAGRTTTRTRCKQR